MDFLSMLMNICQKKRLRKCQQYEEEKKGPIARGGAKVNLLIME